MHLPGRSPNALRYGTGFNFQSWSLRLFGVGDGGLASGRACKGGRSPEGVNCERGLGESEAPQAALEIPCVWRVVTQKRETVLFGAEDSGGWRPGASRLLGWGS